MEKNINFSIVVPAYMSESFLKGTIEEIIIETNKSNFHYEIIIVVDGSPDDTWKEAYDLSKKYKNIKSINLLRNYGQHSANICGFRHAEGEYVITMDDDGQNPPSELAHFEKLYKSEYDLVFGKLVSKKHNLVRRVGSFIISYLNRKIFNIKSKITLSNFRMIRKDVVNRIISDKSPQPYIPGLCLKHSLRQKNVDVLHRERLVGNSNYNFSKLMSLVLELLVQHSYIPLRLIAYIGSFMAFVGIFGAAYIFYSWLAGISVDVQGWRSIIIILLISSGFIMSGISILGLYIIRVIENLSGHQYIELDKSWID